MKILVISDTHGWHHNLVLPDADMIIHAGDLSRRGKLSQVQDFLNWYTVQPHKYKIFIAGNHDFLFEELSKEEVDSLVPSNLIYLNDSSVDIEGIKVWGSPIQPWFHNWAFNRERGQAIQKHWDMIPKDADIVITHGPVAGILDRTSLGQNVGCENLRQTIEQIGPSYHICGHIHEAYGKTVVGATTYINASVLNLGYEMVNSPIMIEI